MVHYLTGFNKHEENLTLCGKPGVAANTRSMVTCKKCLAKLPPEAESENSIDNKQSKKLPETLLNFMCYLVDNCEGETITEEYLLQVGTDFIKR